MLANKFYLISSFFIAGLAILNTYLAYEEFYPTVIHIVKSKFLMLILFNSAIALSVLIFKLITKLFFSTLKEAEVQNMESQSIQHGFNFIIILYMLHLEFDIHIAFHICSNIAVYSLHTLANKRVEYLFTENYPTKSYIQMFIFHILLILLDVCLVFAEGGDKYKTLYLLLQFEYVLMGLFACKSFIVFLLQMYEKVIKYQGWESKAAYLSIVDFLYNLITLATLVLEFAILSKKSALGIYFLDKSLRAIINMWNCFSGYLESRKLVSKVNSFPNATAEDIQKASDKCIFCLEALTEAKKINCGHLFHYKCLRSYFENSTNPKCPTCRATIDEKIVHHPKSEHITQNVASSFLLQDLPNNINPLGNPIDIGATAWGLPRTINSHKISKHGEKMKYAVENMNEFILRFYKHPPDQIHVEDEGEAEDRFERLREQLRRFDVK